MVEDHTMPANQIKSDPPSLVAILIAARQTANRSLELLARRELRETHGIDLKFLREAPKAKQ